MGKIKHTCQFPDCKSKLVLMRFSCKCKKDFCMQHRYPETHNCSIDYLSKNKDNSEEIKKLKCVADKTIII
tara:strand:- start:125 stop:337 length:213 start_codon:yes stop_codon:yes gene_type:complete